MWDDSGFRKYREFIHDGFAIDIVLRRKSMKLYEILDIREVNFETLFNAGFISRFHPTV